MTIPFQPVQVRLGEVGFNCVAAPPKPAPPDDIRRLHDRVAELENDLVIARRDLDQRRTSSGNLNVYAKSAGSTQAEQQRTFELPMHDQDRDTAHWLSVLMLRPEKSCRDACGYDLLADECERLRAVAGSIRAELLPMLSEAAEVLDAVGEADEKLLPNKLAVAVGRRT